MLRNCNVTTVAPTGTISIIAGCSSGLEPLFAVAFMRNQAGVMMPDVNEDFVAIAKSEGWYSDELMERIAKTGSVEHKEVPAKWQKVFITANAIAPEWHIKMQAAFQEHCDSAISKTTNFAYTATKEDVRKIYEMAYDTHCKGVTVYRDGSRDNQVLSTGATAEAAAKRDGGASAGGVIPSASEGSARAELGDLRGQLAEANAEIERLKKDLYEVEAENLQRRQKRSRPDKLRGTTIRKETPLGTMFVNITEDEKAQPFEVFVMLGKAGGSAMADAEAMGRLISLALRSGIPMAQVHRQLRGISSDRAVGFGPNKVLSVPDAIGIALEEWTRDRVTGVQQELPGVNSGLQQASSASPVDVSMTHQVPASLLQGAQREMEMQFGLQHSSEAYLGTCPDCGSSMEMAEGCAKCHVCGFSECG
jgi:ribonucleoside-diphosphate reductase alpha chain